MSKEYLGSHDWTDFNDDSPESYDSTTSNTDDRKYNPKEARQLLEGSLEQRVVNYAEIKHGKGEEVKAELSRGNYRENHEDPLNVLDRICGESKIVDAEFTESIDGVVENYQAKPSMLKVAGSTAKDLVNKSCWYYPLVGVLPGKAQTWVAEKLNDDPVSYTKANMAAETILTPFVAGYIAFQYSQNPMVAFVTSMFATLLSPIFNYGIRRDLTKEDPDAYSSEKYKNPVGSALLCVPLYLTAAVIAAPFAGLYYGYKGLGKVKDAVKDSWQSALQEEQQKQQKRLLPPSEQKRVEQPQYEIVMTPDGEKFEERRPRIGVESDLDKEIESEEELEESDRKHNLKNNLF